MRRPDPRHLSEGARAGCVVEVLSQLVSVHGAPRYVRSDNGPEFVLRAILRWAKAENIDLALSDPGKPWQNGIDESFNGKFRDECLSLEWFRNRTEAKVVIEQWRRHYNEVRPHSRLGYRTPNEFVQQGCSTAKRGRRPGMTGPMNRGRSRAHAHADWRRCGTELHGGEQDD